jgi:hypothetical protein
MQTNGHADESVIIADKDVIDDIKRLATSRQVIEAPPLSSLAPFEQKAHTLMLESIDRVAQSWIEQLKHVRDNTLTIEQLVISTCAKAKDDITRMHLLGAQVLKEAERGDEVCQHLAEGLDAIMGEQRQ